MAAIAAAFEPVRYFPMAAAARDHLAAGVRVVFCGAYAVYFRPTADAVVIVRVVHGSRDVVGIAASGGFRD